MTTPNDAAGTPAGSPRSSAVLARLPGPTRLPPREKRIIDSVKAELLKQPPVDALTGKPLQRHQIALQRLAELPSMQAPMRNAATVPRIAQQLDNVRARLDEIGELLDEVRDQEGLNLRLVIDDLKRAERDLDHTVGRIAGDLGMVEV